MLGIGSLAFRIISADAYRATREKVAQITAYLQETLSGVRVVRDLRPGAAPRGACSPSSTTRTATANMKTVNLNAAYFPAVELLSALVTAGILLYGGIQAIEGDVTVGVLVAFIAALNNFFDPIQQLSQLYTTYQAGMAALDKIFELLDEEPDLRDRRARSTCRGCAASSTSRTCRSPTRPTASRRSTGSTCTSRPARPSRSSAPPARASPPSPSSAARFYDPTEGRILVDGHDLRDVTGALPARADGDRAAGGVPVQRHDPRQPRLRAAGRDARGSRRPRARSAPTTSSPRSSTATTPRSASAASSSRPASASSSPSPAR